jgi:hypothetical protein
MSFIQTTRPAPPIRSGAPSGRLLAWGRGPANPTIAATVEAAEEAAGYLLVTRLWTLETAVPLAHTDDEGFGRIPKEALMRCMHGGPS